MAEEPFQVHMLHLVVRYFCDGGLQVETLDNKTALATPSLPKTSHPGGCARTCVTLPIWNIFSLGVEFSFLLVHILCNNWYVRGIVIWTILAVIPEADKK